MKAPHRRIKDLIESMVVSLKLLRRFSRVRTVVEQRDDHRRALEELGERYDRILRREAELEARNVDLAAAVVDLSSQHRDLLDQLTGGIREAADLKARYDAAEREYQAMLQERDQLLQQACSTDDERRWLVHKGEGDLWLLLDKQSLVDRHVFHHGIWEKHCIDLILAKVKATGAPAIECHFFDIGSYFGQYSLYIKQSIPELNVYAFEANVYNYAQLRTNVMLNGFIDKIETFNRCVTDEEGETIVFAPDPINKGAARIGERYAGQDEQAEPHVVPNLIMDAAFSKLSDAHVFVKMDVEGSEMSALHGMVSFLGRNRSFIQVEDWDHDAGLIAGFMRDQGFSLETASHPDYFYCNY